MADIEDEVKRKGAIQGPSSTSRLPGFYELPCSERLKVVAAFSGLNEGEKRAISSFGALTPELAEVFIENVVGTFGMPLGVATNFLVNGVDLLVPMAVEETSVLAAASHGAKLARAGGGFIAESSAPIMTGQIQLFIPPEQADEVMATLEEKESALIAYANKGLDRLVSRGGGTTELTWRFIDAIESMVVHVHVNTCDAMGANIVNTVCEKLSSLMSGMFGCEVGLRILTNLTDRRTTKVRCVVPHQALDSADYIGKEVVERIAKAYEFAAHDIYRATTNNKGIMNGIDPVLIATGNDWRAIEAGAHAFACRTGQYQPMARWVVNADDNLEGELELPMAVGTVGGVTQLHPTAKGALRLLGNPDAADLANIVCSTGLAQNLSALRALASEGIQRGHMSLHQKNLDLLDRIGGLNMRDHKGATHGR